MRIYLIVNVSQIVQYKEQVERQKKEETKPIEVEGVKEWEIEKILNKRKIRRVEKYLVCWKGFTVEHDIQKREENLGNTREAIKEFERRMSTEVRWQEKLDMIEEKDYRRGKLPGKYMVKMLYRQNNRKFEEEYLKKLERNWQKIEVSFSRGEIYKGG